MFRRIVFIGCLLILVAQAGFQLVMARTDSQTTDESVHVLAGYTYLTKKDFRLNPEHPPLVKVLSALPLLVLKPNLPTDFDQQWKDSEPFFYDSWRENRYLGEQFFYNSGNDTEAMIFWSRVPMVAITMLLGLTIFLIAWRHFGAIGAVIATGFYALDPLVTGHGHLVTTDVAFGLAVLLTAYATWRLIDIPTLIRAVWVGLALGLALLVKHTAVIVAAIILLVVVWSIVRKKITLINALKFAGIALISVWVMIWAGYGFSTRPAPITEALSEQVRQDNIASIEKDFYGTSLTGQTEYQLTEEEITEASKKISGFDNRYAKLAPLFKILPGDYLKGLILVIGHAAGGHDSFLLGQTSDSGWWYYFPILLLFKMPVATLLGLFGLFYLAIRNRPKNLLLVTLLSFAGLFLLSAMTAKANIGLRHIFPILPLTFVSLSWLGSAAKYSREVSLGLLLILSISFATAYPSYLGYFNELSGGKDSYYKIATDSNLDWGQDFKRIRRYIENNQLNKPVVEYSWLGHDAIKYFLGNNYRIRSETKLVKGDIIIIGATALNIKDLEDTVDRCEELRPITNGVFTCRISR